MGIYLLVYHNLGLNYIASRILTALILHNVCGSDCLMSDVNLHYNPANSVENLDNFMHEKLTQTLPDVKCGTRNNNNHCLIVIW